MDTAKTIYSPNSSPLQVGVVYHGDAERRRTATPETSKVPSLFSALTAAGMVGIPVVYNDAFRDDVRKQMLRLDAVLVWVNPIESGQDRTHLDALLREIAAAGIFVSTHPNTIMKIGTKQVLVDTQSLSWSARETVAYPSQAALREALLEHHLAGRTRVLKQFRGHSGLGVWKVEPVSEIASGNQEIYFKVREAPRDSPEQLLTLADFSERCGEYFVGEGCMVDQPWQERLPEGMIRCYLVKNKVQGFGFQAVNALCPAPMGGPPNAFPLTTKREYFSADKSEFQALKRQLENEWVPQLQSRLSLAMEDLPILWDCEFMLGPKTLDGVDSYVLCEINVSSVSPYPEAVLGPLVEAVRSACYVTAGDSVESHARIP